MKLSFTYDQKKAIEAGERRRQYLQGVSKMAAQAALSEAKYRNYYIFGPSGIGKTYNIEKAVKDSGVENMTVSGNHSMFAFFADLMIAKYFNPDNKVVVIIDDCDELFKDAKNINMMKELLDKGRLTYNASIPPAKFGEEGSDAFNAAEEAKREGVGYELELSNFSFIITSNIPLPNEKEVDRLVEKQGGIISTKTAKLKHMLAIATRVMPKNCDFNKEEKWGNIATITLEDAEGHFKALDEQQKIYLLDWMWNNWDKMTQTSVRTAEQMAQMFSVFGDAVRDAWETEYLG